MDSPATGFNMTPPIPFPKPLINPWTPSFSAPFIGCVTSPVTPSNSPRPNSLPASMRPLASPVTFSCFRTVSSL